MIDINASLDSYKLDGVSETSKIREKAYNLYIKGQSELSSMIPVNFNQDIKHSYHLLHFRCEFKNQKQILVETNSWSRYIIVILGAIFTIKEWLNISLIKNILVLTREIFLLLSENQADRVIGAVRDILH